MSELAPLISDLALILICAGVKTSVITPAQIKMSAKSLIRGANSDICLLF